MVPRPLCAVLLFTTSALAAPQQVPDLDFWPQGCLPQQDVDVVNWFDHDRRPDAVNTYRCDQVAADNHTGTDGLIRSFEHQDLGVPIFAVADGTVCSRDDTHFDRCLCYLPDCNKPPDTSPDECRICTSNHVHTIDANGLLIMYRHMKKGSIPGDLQRGFCVKAGQEIGSTGSSGASKHPHIHFGTQLQGVLNDPFKSPSGCNANPSPSPTWKSQPVFGAPGQCRLWDVAVTRIDPSPWERAEWAEHALGGWIQLGDPTVHVWGMIAYAPGDDNSGITLGFDLRKNGVSQKTFSQAINGGASASFKAALDLGGVTLVPSSATTVWTIQITADHDGCVFSHTLPLTVTESGAPPNRAPAAAEAVEIEPAAPTPADALICRVRMPLIGDEDYDVVRYRYVWRTDAGGGSVLREAVHAGQGDAIPRRPQGEVISCEVHVGDGKTWLAPVTAQVQIGDGTSPPCTAIQAEPCGNPPCSGDSAGGPGHGCGFVHVSSWRDVGGGKPGGLGLPRIVCHGLLAAGAPVRWEIRRGHPHRPAILLLGAQRGDLRIFGGTVIPYPPLLAIPALLDVRGAASLEAKLPRGVPSGRAVYVQAWIDDPTATHGLSATNGLMARTR